MREGNTQIGKWKSWPPEARNQWLSTQSGSGSAAAAIPLPASASVPDLLPHIKTSRIYGPACVYVLASNHKHVAETLNIFKNQQLSLNRVLSLIEFIVFILSFIFHVSTFTLHLCQVQDKIHEPMNKGGKVLLMCRIKPKCAWYFWETKGTLADDKSKQQVLNIVIPRPSPDRSNHNINPAWKTAGLMLCSEV